LVRATVADGFLAPPLQHDGPVYAATFDATGERVVTASDDNTARIWDARTGEPIGKTLRHDGSVYAATFDTTGDRVVTASADNTARIWDAPPAVGQALLDRVRAALGRNAPDALKVPDQTQSFVGVIGKGFNTIRTRLTAMLL
jgi:WD40 repeat protein